MSLILSATAILATFSGAFGQCVPLGKAATDAGLTELAKTIGAVADLDGAAVLTDAAAAMANVNDAEDRITVFAPTNEAFEEIASVVATLSKQEVLNVLLYHVAPAELKSTAVKAAIEDAAPDPAEVPTLLDEDMTLEAEMMGKDITVMPPGGMASKVITADVETCVGVVHVIDKVLIPPSDDMAPGMAPGMAPAMAPEAMGPEEAVAPEGSEGSMTPPTTTSTSSPDTTSREGEGVATSAAHCSLLMLAVPVLISAFSAFL